MLTWRCGGYRPTVEARRIIGSVGQIDMFHIDEWREIDKEIDEENQEFINWQLISLLPGVLYVRRFCTAKEAKAKAEKVLTDWLEKAGLQIREEK